jgi:DNA-binding response OmpR family regulator
MSTYSVLLVEDHDPTRKVVARLFAAHGWDVRAAGSLSEALGLLAPAPDCVILDLNLPDGRGEAVLQRIRDENLTTRVVIVTTAIIDTVRLSRIALLKPDLKIMKPFDWDVLYRYCESAMRMRLGPLTASFVPPVVSR